MKNPRLAFFYMLAAVLISAFSLTAHAQTSINNSAKPVPLPNPDELSKTMVISEEQNNKIKEVTGEDFNQSVKIAVRNAIEDLKAHPEKMAQIKAELAAASKNTQNPPARKNPYAPKPDDTANKEPKIDTTETTTAIPEKTKPVHSGQSDNWVDKVDPDRYNYDSNAPLPSAPKPAPAEK